MNDHFYLMSIDLGTNLIYSGLVKALSYLATANSFKSYLMAMWILVIALAWVVFAMGTFYIMAKVSNYRHQGSTSINIDSSL